MVQFNDDSFTITFRGDNEEYLNLVHALSRVIMKQRIEMINEEDHYFACSLLEQMLPEPGQQIKIN